MLKKKICFKSEQRTRRGREKVMSVGDSNSRRVDINEKMSLTDLTYELFERRGSDESHIKLTCRHMGRGLSLL